ncbi:phosphate ABC transporter ATP-binding protein PstB [Paenibacillus wulumuqiensis]|uniref:phosphate ABC transporter ATP-binding protein PstB n=1 Tax=Paenibacillus wulumuqiensis TaxID=1567107 RepID=UPI0009E5DF06
MIARTRESRECDPVSDIIRIEQLNLYYEKHHALKNIGLTIQEKAVTAFIGPSGCGKSTLLRTLNRMNDMIPGTRIEGKVEIAGSDIYGDDVEVEDLRQQVGMVFQQPNPFPKSIYENVAYGPRLQGITSKTELNEIVERSLRQSALWEEVKDYLKKSALSLSGGQQQRLCIARAIASQPDILLMDEATSALDPISTLKIEELTQDLKKDYTIVMVTHNMHQAARISDQTAFFLNGEVVESTDTTEMFSNPTDSRTEDYISGRFG